MHDLLVYTPCQRQSCSHPACVLLAQGQADAQAPASLQGATLSAAPAGPGHLAPLTPEQLQGLAISMDDFTAAVARVQPSVRREGFATTPDVTWADVGALDEVGLGFMVWGLGRSPQSAVASLGHLCCTSRPAAELGCPTL